MPAPPPKTAAVASAPAPIPGSSGNNAQVNGQDKQNAKVDSMKTQEKQNEGNNGATAIPVASTSSQPVTVVAEELTREQKEKLIAAITAPPRPRPRPQTVPVPVPVPVPPPTAQATPTPVPAPPAATKQAAKRSVMPIVRPVPFQRTVAPSPKKAKVSIEPIIKQEEEEEEERFRETFAVWDLRKSGKALQTPKKKKEVIDLGMVSCSLKRDV